MTAEDLAEHAGLLKESPDDEDDVSDGDMWPEELLNRCVRESPEPKKALLLHLATNPNWTFTSAEMADAINRTSKQFSGVLGAFGRRTRNTYAMNTWPFEADWSDEAGGMIYRMPKHVADVISRLAELG